MEPPDVHNSHKLNKGDAIHSVCRLRTLTKILSMISLQPSATFFRIGAYLSVLASALPLAGAFAGFGATVASNSPRTRKSPASASSLASTSAGAPSMGCWEFRQATDMDLTVVADLLERKNQFDRDLSGEPRSTMKPSSGNTLVSLYPEFPTGQILLINHEEQPQTVAGFAMYAVKHYGWDTPPSLWLEDLFVSPTLRSKGAGQALMDELADISHRSWCSHLGWKCHVDNAQGLNFYNRIGASVKYQKADMFGYHWAPQARCTHSRSGGAVPALAATGALV